MNLQVNEAVEDRKALEGQLRHLQAGLTEGQEAARQEGRQEMERLEARLKDLLKDRSVVGVFGLNCRLFDGLNTWCTDPLYVTAKQGHSQATCKMNRWGFVAFDARTQRTNTPAPTRSNNFVMPLYIATAVPQGP